MPKHIETNTFVRRQTRESRFSHFEPASGNPADTWSELEALVAKYAGNLLQNAAGKVVKVPLPAEALSGFYTGVVVADANTQFKTVFAPRAGAPSEELPFIQTVALNGAKSPAKVVEIILYHRSLLSEAELTYTPEGSDKAVMLEGEWQIISINANATEGPEPPTPQAMARNMAAARNLPEGAGGTAREYTSEQWMEAVLYWSRRAMHGGN